MKKIICLLILTMGVLETCQVSAQFKLSGEFRPRSEYRRGFKSLAEKDQDPAFFVDQRTRLNIDYTNEKYQMKIVFQDVRTWGSQPQLVANDGALTTIHEAWAAVNFNENIKAKIGRQEIILDDERIFGNVGWAQQARSHDAVLLRYGKANTTVDMGLAFNQDSPKLAGTFYTVPQSYKSLQYLALAHKIQDNKLSFLFLNNGVQRGTITDANTSFSQTLGVRFVRAASALRPSGSFYLQTGEGPDQDDISAFQYALDARYILNDKSSVAAGMEYLSGNSSTRVAGEKNKAFTPFYGTNHKFNGLMDYFYVGNHMNSVGLQDVYLNAKTKISKVDVAATAHFFSSAQNLIQPDGRDAKGNLGTEVDLVFNYQVDKEINLKAGYSQMFATTSMEILKGAGSKSTTNNWGWLMLTVKPTFFEIKKKNNAD